MEIEIYLDEYLLIILYNYWEDFIQVCEIMVLGGWWRWWICGGFRLEKRKSGGLVLSDVYR